MPKSFRFRHVLVTVLLALGMLAQETWALAGTTGGISGVVMDASNGAAVANATVTVQAPSQTATTVTDANGRFSFLSLAPDTYSVSAAKSNFTTTGVAGLAVIADATQTVTLSLHPSLRTIAAVRAQAGGLVKPGTTADVYSVNAPTQDKISALGGGGSLNSAYSAVASVPGAIVPFNQSGYFQTVHIRGGDYDQIGYEFDGVPVNRSFDNYPSGALSSLGMAELQVYTGAAPATSESQGLAGYINQVIKVGTFPGFATASFGIGSPSYYHKAAVEVGGATPNRLFSYYAGIGGYNQGFRYVNDKNAAEYADFGPILAQIPAPDNCLGGAVDVNYAACYKNGLTGPSGYAIAPYNWAQVADIADRDAILNLHFGIPHKNDSGRDDVQLLFDSAMLHNSLYDSAIDGAPAFLAAGFVPLYTDGYAYNGRSGQTMPASQISQNVSPYLFPNQPVHAAFRSFVPFNGRDTTWNNQEIVKAEYQKNFGSDAYLRLYGYTYYSDWLQTAPVCSFSDPSVTYYGCQTSGDYELSSHTRGVSAQFEKQFGAQHLLSVEGNYTTATTVRDNNTQMTNGTEGLAVLVDPNAPENGVCYRVSGATAAPASCTPKSANWVTFEQAYAAAHGGAPITNYSSVTCGTGPCSWFIAENGQKATYNSVTPRFASVAVTDQWRPTNRLLFNGGVRVDRFQFVGADTRPNDPARDFWFKAFNMDNCVTPAGTITAATSPGVCPAGTTAATLTNVSGQVNTYTKVEPRLSGSYTINPDNVLRFSYGVYAEPPNAAFEQYNTAQENLAQFIGSKFYSYGFTTPSHLVRPPLSQNVDVSWERRLKGTDWSFKLTPFLRKTKDQIQSFYLDQASGFISGFNVGRQTSEGAEFQLNKGDFNQNGLSGMLALTYTHSYINYDALPNGNSIVGLLNNDIKTYNAYTSFCASNATDPRCGATSAGTHAAPCYIGGVAAACSAPGAYANPYWNAPVQNLLDGGAKYATYDIFPGPVGSSASSFEVPYAATMVLNYKHDRFALTPSMQILAGNRYGAPESMVGVDPANPSCQALAGSSAAGDPRYPNGVSGQTGAAGYNAMSCGSVLAVPNHFTGVFDQPGSFVNPTQLLINVQLSYDVSPKVTLVGTVANLVNACFGGSKEPWTVNDRNVCSYGINNSAGQVLPQSNVYNPVAAFAGSQRAVEYPYGAYLSGTNVNGSSTKAPLNAYLEARIKL